MLPAHHALQVHEEIEALFVPTEEERRRRRRRGDRGDRGDTGDTGRDCQCRRSATRVLPPSPSLCLSLSLSLSRRHCVSHKPKYTGVSVLVRALYLFKRKQFIISFKPFYVRYAAECIIRVSVGVVDEQRCVSLHTILAQLAHRIVQRLAPQRCLESRPRPTVHLVDDLSLDEYGEPLVHPEVVPRT